MVDHLLTDHQHEGGAIGSLGRVARSDDSTIGKSRPQARQTRQGGIAAYTFIYRYGKFLFHPFVVLDKYLLHFNGNNLVGKFAFVNGFGRVDMRAQRKFIGFFATDAVFVRYRFSSMSHTGQVIGRGTRNRISRRQFIPRHRDHAHAFGATRQIDVAHPRLDFGNRHGDGFQTRSAITVDGYARYFLSQCPQRDLPPNLKTLFTFGIGAADKYVVNQAGIHLWYLRHEVFDDVYRQVI